LKTNKDTFFADFVHKPFSLITKPIGAACNLKCTYCFYLEKQNLFPESKSLKMTEEVLEDYIKQYIQSQPTPTAQFVWQGGEPTLLGLDYFKTALRLQQKYANGKTIENAFQTNGILLDDEWCAFFHDNNFLIGLSIDGPKEMHDHYRYTNNNGPTFDKVLAAIQLLQKHKVEFNTLTVVNDYNADFPLEVYRFLKSIGSSYMQFLPAVERVSEADQDKGIRFVSNQYSAAAYVTDYSVPPKKYGAFLNAIFDEWVKNDVGSYFIQLFDTTLANWIGADPGICMFSATCGQAGVIEHNGDVFSCDHFVFEEHKLGNIKEMNLGDLMNSPQQQLFGQDKYNSLPQACLKCPFLDKCWGECPKKRFLYTDDGEYGLNYLCEGYKSFFAHVTPAMEYMAGELKNGRSAVSVMQRNDTI